MLRTRRNLHSWMTALQARPGPRDWNLSIDPTCLDGLWFNVHKSTYKSTQSKHGKHDWYNEEFVYNF